MTLLSCWILITLLNFDTILSRNPTGRRYVDGSEFHVELWPRVKTPRWIMTPDKNFKLNCDPNPRSQLPIGSQFNLESRPGVTIQCENMTRGSQFNVKSWTGSEFNVKLWPEVKIQRWVMTRGHNSTWNYYSRVKISRWIMIRVIVPHWIVIQIPGHNLTLNHDSGSQFNVELRPGVIIPRGIKNLVTIQRGLNFIRRRSRNTMTPCLGGGGGRNSTWEIRWILCWAHWIKTQCVEIQWGQNSILHRPYSYRTVIQNITSLIK